VLFYISIMGDDPAESAILAGEPIPDAQPASNELEWLREEATELRRENEQLQADVATQAEVLSRMMSAHDAAIDEQKRAAVAAEEALVEAYGDSLKATLTRALATVASEWEAKVADVEAAGQSEVVQVMATAIAEREELVSALRAAHEQQQQEALEELCRENAQLRAAVQEGAAGPVLVRAAVELIASTALATEPTALATEPETRPKVELGATAAAEAAELERCATALAAFGIGTCGRSGFHLTHTAETRSVCVSLRYRLRRHRVPDDMAQLRVTSREGIERCALDVPVVTRGDPADYAALLGDIVRAAAAVDEPPDSHCAAPAAGMLLSELLPAAGGERLLVSAGAAGEMVPVLQLRVHEQVHPNCCGYHSTHNAAVLLAWVRAGGAGSPTELAAELADGPRFWRGMLRLQARLKVGLAAEKLAEAESAVLERSHMCLLPAVLDMLYPALGGRECITYVPDYNGCWAAQWQPLGEALERLRDTPLPAGGMLAHGFVLGVYKHWVAAVAVRSVAATEASGAERCEILVCDSANKPLGLGLAEAELRAAAEARRATEQHRAARLAELRRG
jgi:nitroreductase